MVSGGTVHGQSDFNARVAARKKKVTWSVDQLDMELSWRRWFPQNPVDWSHDLSAEDADILFAACVSFMQENLHIKVPGKGRIPFQLREAQLEVLYQWIRYRRTVSLKARQVGFSTLSAAFVLWQGFGWSDRLIVMLSRTERESIKLLAKVKYNYKSLPDWVRLRGPQILDRTKQVMTFDNESVIESLPSANDPARGESVFLVVVDEWAFLPNPDEAWASIEPITDIGGRVIGISTANGEGNFFHNLWLGSQMGTNGFKGIFHPWSAVDGRDDEWYEQKLGLMQSWQIAQEYPTTPDEAFVGSGNPVFNLDVIEVLCPKHLSGKGRLRLVVGKKLSKCLRVIPVHRLWFGIHRMIRTSGRMLLVWILLRENRTGTLRWHRFSVFSRMKLLLCGWVKLIPMYLVKRFYLVSVGTTEMRSLLQRSTTTASRLLRVCRERVTTGFTCGIRLLKELIVRWNLWVG